ncbi:hypothetical protein M0R19_06750 [Candidatus Pacearchaeota archaeon]|nr:hypothetical protein [Candidatus Pacearchaeota archaeon]
MRKIFRKVSAIAASALMVGMTMGVAAAANYPAPFVAGGAADVAVVYGTGAGVSSLDLIQAGNIQSNLQSYMGSGSGSTVVSGTAWQVATSSDMLEINEPINDVDTYIGSSDFSLLTTESISNEKGDATYEQFLYFEQDPNNNASVIYTEDDDDNIGLFFYVPSNAVIARYVMDFTTNLKSDIETDSKLSDIEDKMITFLGKTYTITDATNGSSGVELTLMSGALGGTVQEGSPLTVNGYTVEVQVSSSTAAQFTITSASGTETTDKMNKGDIEKLADGNYLAVTDISYEGYAEGNQQATFYIGADKMEWKNSNDMVVNGETIGEAAVVISSSYVGTDISISEISINMTAEDDLYVPLGGKLSENSNLDEPEVLVSQNWDIQFAGLAAVDYEDISLKISESDQQYTLRFNNYNGDEVVLPLVYTNASGVFGGDKADHRLVLDADGSQHGGNITKNDYFILNTADPVTASNDAKTIVVQYKGADDTDSTDPKATFKLNPGAGQVDEVMSIASTGSFTLKTAGGTFTFINASTGINDDFDITLSGAGDYSDGSGENLSCSQYIRTQYNTLINITDGLLENATWMGSDSAAYGASWTINVTIDDSNRDGDSFTLPSEGQVFHVTIANTTTDAAATFAATSAWLTDPSNSDVQKYINRYGAEVTKTDPSDSPASIEAKVPKSIVNPLVYITTGEGVSVSTTTAGTQLGEVLVKDSEVSSVSSKNLIVVGGSCINSVAASLLGATCGSDFTDKTGVGSNQFLIQSLASTYSSGKVALVVAGYEAADTVNAATYLRNQVIDTTVGKKYKGTSATSAELQVA